MAASGKISVPITTCPQEPWRTAGFGTTHNRTPVFPRGWHGIPPPAAVGDAEPCHGSTPHGPDDLSSRFLSGAPGARANATLEKISRKTDT
jgi:hypothetical protein